MSKKSQALYPKIISCKMGQEHIDLLRSTKEYWGFKSVSEVLRRLITQHCIKSQKTYGKKQNEKN